jgi:hypothetical protein
MNPNDVKEYVLWLEKFKDIYKKYIDKFDDLREIFAETLEKLKKILINNNKTIKDEDIIRLLKELVRKFSFEYEQNNNINKNPVGVRKTDAFKQNIYIREIAELKEWLIENINNTELFPNFESIVMFVAKKRQMIEFLKLGRIIQSKNINRCVFFEIFGKRRDQDDGFRSDVFRSHGQHLFDSDRRSNFQIIYNGIYLTRYASGGYNPFWTHTYASLHPELFKIMNELYTKFLSLANRRNNASKKDIFPELYWLYMQTCPFKAGSAAIGEILFSVLLRKYFECDFLISNGWNGNPLTIPDIHALHYELEHFKSIFWDQFTNCNLKKNSNINNKK